MPPSLFVGSPGRTGSITGRQLKNPHFPFEDFWKNILPLLEKIMGSHVTGLKPATKSESGTSESQADHRLSMEEYMNLYTLVYRFLAKNRLEYGKEWKLYLKMHTHLQEHCSAVLKVGITKQGDSLLDFYNQRYEEYLFSTKVLRDRLDYLDRVWVIDQQELPDTLAVKAAMGLEAFGRPLDEKAAPLNTMCLIVWREAVMTSDFMTALYNAAASMVLRNRDGEKIETRLIKGITGCFEQMGADGTTAAEKLAIYKIHFEAKFLQATGEYYAAESRALIDDGIPVNKFLAKVDERIKEENGRLDAYLHESTTAPLNKVLDTTLLSENMEWIMAGCKGLMQQGDVGNLHMAYKLLARIENGHDALRKCFSEHTVESGQLAIKGCMTGEYSRSADPASYVNAILTTMSTLDAISNGAFTIGEAGSTDENATDGTFVLARNDAYTSFINQNRITSNSSSKASRSSELLAVYCDMVQKEDKRVPAGDIDQVMDDAMKVFVLLESKDAFTKYYKKDLATRLIRGQITGKLNDDNEQKMVKKLRASTPASFTKGLRDMFTDLSCSTDLLKEYTVACAKASGTDIDAGAAAVGAAAGTAAGAADDSPAAFIAKEEAKGKEKAPEIGLFAGGVGAPAAAAGGFGAPAAATGGFGAPTAATGGFGAPAAATGGFGAPAAATGGFGAPVSATGRFGPTGGFGAPPAAAGGFGAPPAATGGFGAPTAAAGGFSGGGFAFGSSATTGTSIFAAKAAADAGSAPSLTLAASPDSFVLTDAGGGVSGDLSKITGTYERFKWEQFPSLAPFGEKYSKNMYMKAGTNYVIMQWDEIGHPGEKLSGRAPNTKLVWGVVDVGNSRNQLPTTCRSPFSNDLSHVLFKAPPSLPSAKTGQFADPAPPAPASWAGQWGLNSVVSGSASSHTIHIKVGAAEKEGASPSLVQKAAGPVETTPLPADAASITSIIIFPRRAQGWPFKAGAGVQLPRQLELSLSHFGAYFIAKHPERKLSWQLNQSIGEIECLGFRRKNRVPKLEASAHQIAVLMLFNRVGPLARDGDGGIFEKLTPGKTGESEDRKHLLGVLAQLVKYKVLIEEKGSNPMYTLNRKWNYKIKKLTDAFGPAAASSSSAGDNSDSSADLRKQRTYMMQAFVVKTMKASSGTSVKLATLEAEVIKACSSWFVPKERDIGKTILGLIEKGYIKRTAGVTKEFEYLPA